MPFLSRTAAMATLSLTAAIIATPTAFAECVQPDQSAAQQVIAGISAARSAAGLPPLRTNARLVRLASAHSKRMARTQSIWHDDLAAWANGRAVAQNVAYGGSGDEAFNAMWNSSPHRTAMMSRKYRFMGVGAASACNGEIMVSVDLMGAAARR